MSAPSFRALLRPRPDGPDLPGAAAPGVGSRRRGSRGWSWAWAWARRRPELAGLVLLTGTLNLWALGRNGWANTYYAAAVRSMSTNWHDFLYGSMDPSGVMTVDKPPMALWVQALSVRVFGYHPLSILVPQALMGIATVVIVYDLVRRRFGRVGGFVAGLALAITPITVAISRHNNPDSLLILCSVAALWCALRALENGRTRWLVAAGVCVGLGFETKMGVALMVVPGIAVAWMWVARGSRWAALRQLLAGGAAMAAVGLAWPILVVLTPAADRPFISGTSDNNIFSLIFGYNGLGRLDGQSGGPAGGPGGGPGGGASNTFGGSTGVLRLLNSALGGQAGWLLGLALVSGLALLAVSRLRRADPRTGWLIVVGGAFLTTAVAFSFAAGIFHPYYVSLLAPFVAALVGAGAGALWRRELPARIVGPLALVVGVVCELAVLHDYPGSLSWLRVVLPAVGAVAAVVVILAGHRIRLAALAVGLGALLLAPAIWATDALGYATSGTFPSGGPENVASIGGPGGFGGRGGFGVPGGRGGFAGRGGGAGVPLFGSGGAATAGGSAPASGGPAAAGGGAPLFGSGGAPAGGAAAGGPPSGLAGGAGGAGVAGGGFGGGGAGGFGGGQSLTSVLDYIDAHGGGTLAVSSQSTAATAIIDSDANVAGIGGFSGRESDPSIAWLATEVRVGNIRWVLSDGTSAGGSAGAGGFGGLPGDTRPGASAAMAAAEKACQAVSLPSTATTTGTLYDCSGDASALLALSRA